MIGKNRETNESNGDMRKKKARETLSDPRLASRGPLRVVAGHRKTSAATTKNVQVASHAICQLNIREAPWVEVRGTSGALRRSVGLSDRWVEFDLEVGFFSASTA